MELEPLIQIIGLPRSYRGLHLEMQLKRLNLKFISKLGIELDPELYKHEVFHSGKISKLIIKRKITRGEIACTLAHEKAYERLLNSLKQISIIFEDDVSLTEFFNVEQIQNAFTTMRPTILILGSNKNFTVINQQKLGTSTNILELMIPPTGAYAYAINRAAAEIILNQSKEMRTVADWPIACFSKIEFIATNPIFARLSDLNDYSIIDKIAEREFAIGKVGSVSVLRVTHSFLRLFGMKLIREINLSINEIIYAVIFRDLIFKISKPSKYGEYKIIPKPYHFVYLLLNFMRSRSNKQLEN